ncbi:heme ABC transporter ATP-binding protein [Sphingobacterium psychroaquaticum]|uniref:Iron complex transport system ATP-binding protein n=1 Tax=Sphingobacterium psychroaquaticum TaxID=561061 RepID=A0A1X7HWI2_9SPHI|nr:heme ABC transporter ATP-binding protein [Sphingobacterium psychroaquaticum]SMG06058.1 iron complex transport system ATP-binding protein [Sphingobacterium psychroaquaticum]
MLIAENLTYTVKKHTILKGINFVIHPGEVVALLGANGAGKSSLLKLLSAEQVPSEGQISLFGTHLKSYTAISLAKMRATMAQHHQVSTDFTVAEVVMMGRYPHYNNQPQPNDIATVQETMLLCGIDHLAERSILSLSGGESQRVHLARVLAQLWGQPRAILLLDEPISAMDIKFQHHTLAIARTLAEKGWIIVAVLHDINLAAQYADRLLLMKNGRKLMDGTPSEVLNSRNIYTIFGIDAEIVVNPKTLHTYIVPKALSSVALPGTL